MRPGFGQQVARWRPISQRIAPSSRLHFGTAGCGCPPTEMQVGCRLFGMSIGFDGIAPDWLEYSRMMQQSGKPQNPRTLARALMPATLSVDNVSKVFSGRAGGAPLEE